MTFANNTRFAAVALPYVAADGQDVVLAIVKASFVVTRGRALITEAQAAVRCNDVMQHPEAEQSSIRYPSEVGTGKRGTDVVVIGHAIAVKATSHVDTMVAIGRCIAPLRVHGTRVYYRGMGGLAVSPGARFERRAIVYEDAYGGTSTDLAVVEQRNPVGRGVAAREAELVDQPAPSIEHPARPLRAGAASEPVGYGAIGTSWLPRARFYGSCDARWMQERMPLAPLDFDPRFNNVAHPTLQLESHVRAGERLAIGGMTPEGSWCVELPAVSVVIRGKRDDGQRFEDRPSVDLVLVEPELDRLELTVRTVLPKGRGRAALREVQIDEESLP